MGKLKEGKSFASSNQDTNNNNEKPQNKLSSENANDNFLS